MIIYLGLFLKNKYRSLVSVGLRNLVDNKYLYYKKYLLIFTVEVTYEQKEE